MCYRVKDRFYCGCEELSAPIWCPFARANGSVCSDVRVQDGEGTAYTCKCAECQANDDDSDDS